MQTLTTAQEEIMQIVWELGECTVGDVRDFIEAQRKQRPPHSTVSAVMLALDKLGFLTHKTYGRTFVYRPVYTREEYAGRNLRSIIKDYFSGSTPALVAHLVRREDLSLDQLNALLHQLEEE